MTAMRRLTIHDCLLLTPVLNEEAVRLFPLPVTAALQVCPGDIAPFETAAPDEDIPCGVERDEAPPDPFITGSRVIVPLHFAVEQAGAMVLTGHDPALLRKLSVDWLKEYRRDLERQFLLVVQIYLDPATGVYNERALQLFLQTPPLEGTHYSLYIISTFFVRRTTQAGFRRIRHLAGFFSAMGQGVLFFLGQGVFALLVPGCSREKRLALAHTLQRHLKREGLQKVHVAFADFSEKNERLFSAVMQGLSIAEQRGPFGICDVDKVARGDDPPFAPFAPAEMRELQRWWRGMDRFCLLLFQPEDGGAAESLTTRLAGLCEEKERCLRVAGEQVAFFLPGKAREKAEGRARELIEELDGTLGKVSVGIGWYPCLNLAKRAIVSNCRKALLHGSFYGPGSIVVFDFLSLNVSGDWYFEEGDFRQAVLEYSRGLQLRPGESNLLNSLGVALTEMNRTSGAVKTFREVLAQEPDNYMALVNLGYALQIQGREAEALESFEKARAVQFHAGGTGGDIDLQLGRLYCTAGRYDKALALLEQRVKKQDQENEFLLYRLLGQAYAETGRSEEGMRALQRALRLYPHDSVAMSLLGLLYVRGRQGEEAGMVLLNKALAVDDGRADNWYRLAQAQEHLGRDREALEAVRRCLRLKRSHVEAVLLQGRLQRSTGSGKLAARTFRRVLGMKSAGSGQKLIAAEELEALQEERQA